MEPINILTIEPIIQRFLQGKATPEEEKMLYDWVKNNPENGEKLFREKDLWEASRMGSEQLQEIEMIQWFRLHEQIVAEKQKVDRLKEILRIAAIIVISIGAGWLGHFFYSAGTFTNQQVEMKRVEATRGQLKEVFLPDGTHVWLNSASNLSFPSEFSSKNREIRLTGEAYFEVNANEESPFLVKTKNHTVKVTGTQFNICEYPDDNIIETTLKEGKVKIITGHFIKDLLPGQQSGFNTETSEIRISEADLEIYTAWTEGRYEFNNEPISKIFTLIERWWDVEIDYPEEALKNERITGVLRRHKPLQQHFDIIKRLVPMNYNIESDFITVSVK